MATGVNRVILIGYLGKDPETQNFENGLKKVSFSLATTESFKNKDGSQHTEWHNIVLWRKSAEIAEKWLKKGSQIYLEGSIRMRQWEDKDGNKRYTTEIFGDNFTMLGGTKQPGETTATTSNEPDENYSPDLSPQGDDLPF
jgi:single-strand DNA-binding protein